MQIGQGGCCTACCKGSSGSDGENYFPYDLSINANWIELKSPNYTENYLSR